MRALYLDLTCVNVEVVVMISGTKTKKWNLLPHFSDFKKGIGSNKSILEKLMYRKDSGIRSSS